MSADFNLDEEKNKEGEVHELVEFSEFKGNKMIVLRRTPTDQYPFQFGVTKAKMIMDNIEAIEGFVSENAKG